MPRYAVADDRVVCHLLSLEAVHILPKPRANCLPVVGRGDTLLEIAKRPGQLYRYILACAPRQVLSPATGQADGRPPELLGFVEVDRAFAVGL